MKRKRRNIFFLLFSKVDLLNYFLEKNKGFFLLEPYLVARLVPFELWLVNLETLDDAAE